MYEIKSQNPYKIYSLQLYNKVINYTYWTKVEWIIWRGVYTMHYSQRNTALNGHMRFDTSLSDEYCNSWIQYIFISAHM